MTTLHHMAVPTRILLCSVLLLVGPASQPLWAQASPEVTEVMVQQWMTDLSNWGRWGDDDQLGTLNLITAEKRLEAIGLARVGTSVSLSHNYLKEQAWTRPLRSAMRCSGSGVRVCFAAIGIPSPTTGTRTPTWTPCAT